MASCGHIGGLSCCILFRTPRLWWNLGWADWIDKSVFVLHASSHLSNQRHIINIFQHLVPLGSICGAWIKLIYFDIRSNELCILSISLELMFRSRKWESQGYRKFQKVLIQTKIISQKLALLSNGGFLWRIIGLFLETDNVEQRIGHVSFFFENTIIVFRTKLTNFVIQRPRLGPKIYLSSKFQKLRIHTSGSVPSPLGTQLQICLEQVHHTSRTASHSHQGNQAHAHSGWNFQVQKEFEICHRHWL